MLNCYYLVIGKNIVFKIAHRYRLFETYIFHKLFHRQKNAYLNIK